MFLSNSQKKDPKLQIKGYYVLSEFTTKETVMSGAWIQIPQPKPDAEIRLLCLPHAGGTASLFRPWLKLLPDSVELILICLPGREQRCNESMPTDMSGLITLLAHAVEPLLNRPWAIFGHSMGASVAYELILALQHRDLLCPEHLFVSAREAPQFQKGGNVHALDDDALCQELVRLGGTAAELLDIPELRALLLPAIRQDYRLIETYQPVLEEGLDCPITVLIGSDDSELNLAEAVGWRKWTKNEFQLREFAGHHFYLSDCPGLIVNTVIQQLGLSRLPSVM